MSIRKNSTDVGAGMVRMETDKNSASDDNEKKLALTQTHGSVHIQMIAIGGSIGTASFVLIATGLAAGGPCSLFLAYTSYACVMGLVNNCLAEMASFQPVTGAFIRMAGKWVDESFGSLAGWKFFIYEAILIPFELPALNLVLSFWRDDIPVAAVIAVAI
ncbi:hypothetical protein diail_11511, partial [Diaporthe ilicicola]